MAKKETDANIEIVEVNSAPEIDIHTEMHNVEPWGHFVNSKHEPAAVYLKNGEIIRLSAKEQTKSPYRVSDVLKYSAKSVVGFKPV